jgi:hypothetical protein
LAFAQGSAAAKKLTNDEPQDFTVSRSASPPPDDHAPPSNSARRSAWAGTTRRNSRILQTGTGTVHTTAITSAVITAVIFSLVDRSRRPPGTMPTSPPPCYAASRGYAVTVITLRAALIGRTGQFEFEQR